MECVRDQGMSHHNARRDKERKARAARQLMEINRIRKRIWTVQTLQMPGRELRTMTHRYSSTMSIQDDAIYIVEVDSRNFVLSTTLINTRPKELKEADRLVKIAIAEHKVQLRG